jgi:excisionase family DNA binding protein
MVRVTFREVAVVHNEFRSHCHDCGSVVVPAGTATVRVHAGSLVGTCRFACPRCNAPTTAPMSMELAAVLVGAGATLDATLPTERQAPVDDDVIDLSHQGARADAPSTRGAPRHRQADGFAVEPLLRPGEAAKLLGVSPAGLRRFHASGRLVAVRTCGGQRRYREDDVLALDRWLQRRAS